MINKMRITVYKTHVSTLKANILKTTTYWTTGEACIDEGLLQKLFRATEECDRQLSQLEDYTITATSHRKAHDGFADRILAKSHVVRKIKEDAFPCDFIIGSFSMPYILDAMEMCEREVGKLGRERLETKCLRDLLADYLEFINEVVA